jgi:hypothetical protein
MDRKAINFRQKFGLFVGMIPGTSKPPARSACIQVSSGRAGCAGTSAPAGRA